MLFQIFSKIISMQEAQSNSEEIIIENLRMLDFKNKLYLT